MSTSQKRFKSWKVVLAIFSLVSFFLLEFQVRFNDANKLNCVEWVVDAEEEVDSDNDLLGQDFFIESFVLLKQEIAIGLCADFAFNNALVEQRFNACPRYIQFNQLRIFA